MCPGGTGDPRAEVLPELSILGKGPEKQQLAGGEGGFLEDGSVCEIRATVDMLAGREPSVRKEDSLCSRMEWKVETVRSGCVRDG